MSAWEEVRVDGAPAQGLPPDDRGLHYGDGVFETLAVVDGRPLWWEAHWARLRRGLHRLDFETLPDEAELRGEALALCEGRARAVLKILVTRGSGPRGYAPRAGAPRRILLLGPWPEYPPAWRRDGVTARYCTTRWASNPRLAGIKHLNRLEQVLARGEWREGYAEGLMCDQHGRVVGGTMTNLFLVTAEGLLTPELSRCGVAGVTRAWVMERARAWGLALREAPLDREQVAAAGALFLTNSLAGVWPVRRLAGREYPVDEVTRRLQEALPF